MLNIKIITCFILSFLFAMVISPLAIKLINKIGIKQTTLFYVDNHSFKSGTPTMGGMLFLLPLVVIGLIYTKNIKSVGSVAIIITLAYGLIGFLDDFIKIKFKQNMGLKPYQKIISQLSLSLIVAVYAYSNEYIGSNVYLPFINKWIDLKWGYIIFVVIIYIASTNSVNLTDGLDGLAAKTAIAYFSSFLIILLILLSKNKDKEQLISLVFFDVALLGGLFAFLWQNAYPAKIFMGDTGSLAIGSAVASIAIATKNPFLILIIGIMYVITSISVIMQVIYFKCTKKRIFKMAPLHHHLEYKGIKESKIVSYYTIITMFFGVIGIYSQLMV